MNNLLICGSHFKRSLDFGSDVVQQPGISIGFGVAVRTGPGSIGFGPVHPDDFNKKKEGAVLNFLSNYTILIQKNKVFF